MTLPHSYGLVLMLTILTMICWGSWATCSSSPKAGALSSSTMTTRLRGAGPALAGLTFARGVGTASDSGRSLARGTSTFCAGSSAASCSTFRTSWWWAPFPCGHGG